MTGASIAPATFLKSLLDFISSIASGRKVQMQAIGEIADRKFKDIDLTHEAFMKIIDDFIEKLVWARGEIARNEKVNGQILVDKIVKAIDLLDESRKKSMNDRRSAYEEAVSYRSMSLDKSIINKVPDEIVVLFREFLQEYCLYFEFDDRMSSGAGYGHGVGWLADQVDTKLKPSLWRYGIARSDNDLNSISKKFMLIINVSENAVKISREDWAKVSRAYHDLKLGLLERKFLI